MKKFCVILCLIILPFSKSFAQDLYWPSPEIEQMYKQARQHLERGAIKQSIVLFSQAIERAPQVMLLRRDLAYALNLAGEHEDAYKTIEPIFKDGQADEMSYQIAAVALLGKGEKKKTKNIIQRGLKAYPKSGRLYNELGKYYENNDDMEYALDAWVKGIEADPGYHMNYYNAARVYATTSKPIWTIMYGEIFINLERYTNRSTEIRGLMLQAYKSLPTTLGKTTLPKFGTNIVAGEDASFETAVMHTMQQLLPLLNDGVTTDNLMMLRTRFIMDWKKDYAAQYPFSLFAYHDQMLGDGEFEAYNQWLFGKAENAKQFESWTKFHLQAIPDFEAWAKTNQYKPKAEDFYNSKNFRALFAKKKKA
jgi:tetratricopeptide (TPR) repeat protein